MLTAGEARKLLDYDVGTGVLRWKENRYCGKGHKQLFVKKGDVAGSVSGGYINVSVNGRLYRSHRLAWLIHYGEWPSCQVDHINGNRSDNRLINLRLAGCDENARNAKRRVDNTSGYKGVSKKKNTGRWGASIAVGSKKKHLGYFNSPQEAHEAYKVAAARLHGEFARSD